MGVLYQTGARVVPGTLVVSHPHWNDGDEQVIIITESNQDVVAGLRLNHEYDRDLATLLETKNMLWQGNEKVYSGGAQSPGSLIMLHDTDWFSSNTMQINSEVAMSSDMFMLEKFSTGNLPLYYRMILGITAWEANDFVIETMGRRPKWLMLPEPDPEIVFASSRHQYERVLEEHSKYLTDLHFS
jgi:putative AlgH/UPF0301 family transcriptional regulator